MSDTEENKLFAEDEIALQTDTSVPMLLSDKVKVKHLSEYTFWCLRLRPDSIKDYSMEDVQEFMDDLSVKGVWLLCEELSKKKVKHFHTTFMYPNNLDPRQEIKNWLLEKYTSKWAKADGNKRYNLAPAKDNNKENKAFIYVTKDGDFIYGNGLNKAYVEYVNSQSYQKKDTRVAQLMVSRELYIKGELTDRELFDSVCDVCIATSTTGSLNMNYVKSFMTGAKAQKDPRYRDELFSKCL